MRSDVVFRSVLLLIVLVSAPVGIAIRANHKHRCSDDQSGVWCPRIADFGPSIVVAGVLVLLHAGFLRVTQPVGRVLIHKGKTPDPVYEEKVRRMSHNAFKTLYFLMVTFPVYYLLQQEAFFPSELGGNPPENTFTVSALQVDLISSQSFHCIQLYFFIAAGFQLSLLYFLWRDSVVLDRSETLVQVTLALQLIFYGYMGRYLAMGACLLFVHDLCDVLVSACKTLVDTQLKMTTFAMALVLMVLWSYSRIYCLVVWLLAPLLKAIDEDKPWLKNDFEPPLFAILLLALLFMNIYWLCLLTKSCFIFVTSGRLMDAHAPTLHRHHPELKKSQKED